MAKKPYLSNSQIKMMERCGVQYEFRYIKGIKIPPGIALLVGRSVDDTTGHNLTNKMNEGELLPAEAIHNFAAESFNREWEKSDVALTEDEMKLGLKVAKGKGLDKSVRLASLHADKMAPTIQPTHIQREIKIELMGFPYDLKGYIDIQEGNKSIRDTKTSGKTPVKDIADKDDQLTIYAMMARVIDGVIPKLLHLDYLIDTKTPKAQVFSTERTEEDFKPILRRVEAVSIALEKGVFIPATEGNWWCSERFCGYWNICPYVKRSRRSVA